MELIPALCEAPRLRWGVLAAGHIASDFVTALRRHTTQDVVAVGSRSLSKAQAFADAHGIPAAHGSYEDLVAEPGVDVVYVASPQSRHMHDALLAIEAGKHVLVEKPFALDAVQARRIVDAARAKGVFCMEAMWAKFLPHWSAIRETVASGVIGDVVSVRAEHDQWFPWDPSFRLFSAELGGGALIELGIYPLTLAIDLLGFPTSVSAHGTVTATGVDGQETIVLRHEGGAVATLHASVLGVGENAASIIGTRGRIDVEGWFYLPASFTVTLRDGVRVRYENAAVDGLQFEAAEVARCISAGLVESPRMPLDETVRVMALMDEIRSQIGVRFPHERRASA